jgi:transcriptional regulator with XRE-family HTH domain
MHGAVDRRSLECSDSEETEPVSGKAVGRRIVRLRGLRSWTQADLAARLGVSRERLGHWERGRYEPSLADLAALGAVLDTSLDELIAGRQPAGCGMAEAERRQVALHLEALTRLLVTVENRSSGVMEAPDVQKET